MSESISQGIPSYDLKIQGLKLLKLNDISFTNLKKHGFNCNISRKKPDQFVTHGNQIIVAIEDKESSSDLEKGIKQIKDNYLDALPDTNYFVVRAGELVSVFYRVSKNKITEIGITNKGKETVVFGPKIISGENDKIAQSLAIFSIHALRNRTPVNGNLEINPPKEYYNPLVVKQDTIYNLWQKIFVSTGENASICLATFVELLLYKGISDAKMLPKEFSIESLAHKDRTNSLETYKSTIRGYIKNTLFPNVVGQPSVINGFAFEEQETVFKTVLKNLIDLGDLANRQIDPDFKRRVIEAFLGSAHKEGTIKSGKHLTPRAIIQAIWEMANPKESKKIIDPACGVGGFVLEGLNYPYEFSPLKYNCVGIDRDEQMIITAKANFVLHVLDKFSDPSIDNKKLAQKAHETFFQARNNGTGTLGELEKSTDELKQFTPKHPADYIFANVPFYVNGVKQIDESLSDIGLYSFYQSCGLGVESRFLKYILSQIKNGDPGYAFVIVTDGILYRHKDNIRNTINENADVVGIISLPEGTFQNNNWKTSILIFKKKGNQKDYSPVFLYDIKHIGISLDSFRTPTEQNDIPGMKKAWERRYSGTITDPKCRMVPREEFLNTDRWISLFEYTRNDTNEDSISFPEFIESAETVNKEISDLLGNANKKLSDVFSLETFTEIKLGDEKYFETGTYTDYLTIKKARLNPGEYPLFSSQVDKPAEFTEIEDQKPILIDNLEKKESEKERIISWNIKGDPCKDIRLHESPFYVTENRGLVKIKDECIHLYYLLYYLREHLIELGQFSRSNEAHAGKVKNLSIKFPTNEKGEIDLDKQKQIAKNYESILDLRKSIRTRIDDFENLISNIDVFK